MLMSLWQLRKLYSLLVELQIGTATMEISAKSFQKLKVDLLSDLAIQL